MAPPLFGPIWPLKILFLHPYWFLKHGPYMGGFCVYVIEAIEFKIEVTSDLCGLREPQMPFLDK